MLPLVLNIQSATQLRRVLNRIKNETEITWRNGQKPNGNNFYLADRVCALCLECSQAGRLYLVWDHINTKERLGSSKYRRIEDEDLFIRYLQVSNTPTSITGRFRNYTVRFHNYRFAEDREG